MRGGRGREPVSRARRLRQREGGPEERGPKIAVWVPDACSLAESTLLSRRASLMQGKVAGKSHQLLSVALASSLAVHFLSLSVQVLQISILAAQQRLHQRLSSLY